MKFKSFVNKEIYHKSPVSCLDWSNNDEVYSVSDEHQIYKWNVLTRESVEVAKLPEDFVPTDLHWLLGKSIGGKGSDSLLITSNDGRFVILNKSARVERNITAHAMAITSGRWSPDGAGLLTASEDGVIKIWSRSGMLRSTVIQSEESIRCARWSPASNAIVFSQGKHISIKPLAANSKLMKWRAHDGFVLCLSWSSDNSLIASGGEDLRYKLWDAQGANIYTSAADEYAITSIEFSPNNDVLAVGGFNMLKLCSNLGWSYNVSRFTNPTVGSLYAISWAPDGVQVVCGSSTGNLVFSHIIEKQLISRNLKATTIGRKTIVVQDVVEGVKDTIDFSDRIITFALGYGHLVAATGTQIHIFNENYINTPIIVDGRTDVRILEIASKFFLVIDNSSMWIYTYTGRLHLNPRFPGSQAQMPSITPKCVSLGLDTIVIRDSADQKVVHVFDLLPGATRQNEARQVHFENSISEVAASRAGNTEDQYFVVIDVNRELYITSARNEAENEIQKIGTQVLAVMWASETNILVGLHDSSYSIWYCPGEGSSDPTIISLTTVTVDSTEFGRNVSLESFEDSFITFRSSGAAYTVSANMYCEIMHKTLMEGSWRKALRICRIAQNIILWATLAAIATKKNHLEVSEEAYAAALQVDKVYYLQHIKSLPEGSPEQMAEKSLLLGRLVEAETILLHNKKFIEAIKICLRMHNWKKALEIANKNNIDIDIILKERKFYLEALGRDEFDAEFLKLSQNE